MDRSRPYRDISCGAWVSSLRVLIVIVALAAVADVLTHGVRHTATHVQNSVIAAVCGGGR